MMYAVCLLIIALVLSVSRPIEGATQCLTLNSDCTNNEKGNTYICGDLYNSVNNCNCGQAETCIAANVFGAVNCQQATNCIAYTTVSGSVYGQCSSNVTCDGIGGDCHCGAADTCFCSSVFNNNVYVRPDATLNMPPKSADDFFDDAFGSNRCKVVHSVDGGSTCLSAGAIAGIVIACIVLLAILVFLCYRKRRYGRCCGAASQGLAYQSNASPSSPAPVTVTVVQMQQPTEGFYYSNTSSNSYPVVYNTGAMYGQPNAYSSNPDLYPTAPTTAQIYNQNFVSPVIPTQNYDLSTGIPPSAPYGGPGHSQTASTPYGGAYGSQSS